MYTLRQKLADLLVNGELDLPLPGNGQTAARHAALYALGRTDLSLARLAEAHADAVAILAQAGRIARPGALYGVWASDGPASRLQLIRGTRTGFRLTGTKRFCSGAPLLHAALVTARWNDNLYLVDIRLNSAGLTIDASEWSTPAFRETYTAVVNFEDVEVKETDIIGDPEWYLQRPGFWHGALGPAACWAGGAAGLVDAARKLNPSDPHAKAQLGALESAAWGLRAVLRQAGDEIDADPEDADKQAPQRALMARHLIERLCTDVLDRFGRATGPRLLSFNAQVAQRYSELTLYIRQCHAERDLASIPTY